MAIARLLISFFLIVLAAAPAKTAEKIIFGTDWRAQAEHGGFYQALARGFYRDAGLDVEIRQGGPQINHALLLAAGRVDFSLSSNSFIVLNYQKENIPMVAVAAIFQKDPSVLIAHPGQSNDSFESLRGKPIYIGADTRVGWWQFLKARFGYTDDQIRPYTFSIAPFLTDKNVVQQGYLGSEPFLIKKQGIKPVVLLIADAGFQGYGALLQTSRTLAMKKPAIVRAFVAATAKGWQDYLTGNPAPANALIRQANPEMTDALLTYGRAAMIDNGIVLSGEAAASGIGAMTESRWKNFFDQMAAQGLYRKDMNWRAAFSLRFLPGPATRK